MALHSALRQRGVDFEVLVIDEGSTDDTPAVLAAVVDTRLRVIRHDTPQGVSSARNHGGAEARGEWLAFLDDDDLWAPDKLTRQLEAARDARRDWAYTGSVNIGEHGRMLSGRPPLPPGEVAHSLRRYNAIPGGGSNVVVRRTTWVEAGPFDTRLRNTPGEAWAARLCVQPAARVSGPRFELVTRHTRDRPRHDADRATARHDRRLGQVAPMAGRVVSADRAPQRRSR
jgi:glycosyltransferase involved in cell wall biosynthesis